MDKFYEIAGLTVKMETIDWIEASSIPYEVDETTNVDITIPMNWEEEQENYPDLSDSAHNYNVTARGFYRALVNFNGMMLHSSAVALNGKAYLFSADCGTGKSTHAKLWRRVFGDEKVRVINDDKPAIRCEDGVWYAYGTPWSGKTSQNLNLKCPLGGIAFIEQSETNRIERYSGPEMVGRFFKQVGASRTPENTLKVLSLIDSVVNTVPVWRLQCNMDPEAARVAYNAMSEAAP